MLEFFFTEYTASQRKQYINAKQLYERYIQQKNRYYRDFNLSMFWKKAGGNEYLTKQYAISKKTSSLGVRNEKTQKIYDDFIAHKQALKAELNTLETKLDKTRKLNKIELITRTPKALVKIFQKINELDLNHKVLLIGTNSLYAYEAYCGLFVDEDQLATDDIDLLNKKSKEVSLIFTEVLPRGKLSELLRLIDRSFEKDAEVPYRFRNKEGVILELINPIGQKIVIPEYREDPLFTDIISLEMEGMQWLENSRIFEAMVVGDNGECSIIPTIHPLEFAVYKNWLSQQHDRDIIKKQRDYEQAVLVTQLIKAYMLNIDIDEELANMRHFKKSVIELYRKDMKL